VESSFQEIDYPILVDGRSFSMLSYPLASVVSEKLETMVSLADINSRMKDFWDVAYLLEHDDIPDEELLKALRAPFHRRGTPTPAKPAELSSPYANSDTALARWRAFMKRSHLPFREWVMRFRLFELGWNLCTRKFMRRSPCSVGACILSLLAHNKHSLLS
jgi:hypothetical protein